MNWIEFVICTSKEAEEAVANVLNDCGANGVVIKDIQDVEKIKNNSMYGEIYEIDTSHYPEIGIEIKGYFPDNGDWQFKQDELEKSVRELQIYDIPLGTLYFSSKTVKEEDWENEWKNYFHVQKVTNRMTIVPSWEAYQGTNTELLIYIDPGMAFGTGTHPTTILSLQALEKLVQNDDQIIDVGVGSGILSIGACLLGASHVYGYDLDPIAVKSATLNRDLNGFQSRITLEKKDLLKDNTVRANLVVSNILAEILVDLVEDAYRALQKNGYFITSGIIQNKQALVEDKLIAVGFTIIEKMQMDQWVSIIAQKKES